MKITELPAEERPRERMARQGARALSSAELLAVILRTGTKQMNVVQTAQALLKNAGGRLSELSHMSVESLSKVPGIGKSKALQIAACAELARRLAEENATCETNNVIKTAHDAFRVCEPLFSSDRSEECWVLFLKSNSKMIGHMRASHGGESTTCINYKSILKKAIDLEAKAVILSHNHPSGNCQPSTADIEATEHLGDMLKAFDIQLLDHIILSDTGYFSFAGNETIPKSGIKCKKM